jgi:glycerol kinase
MTDTYILALDQGTSSSRAVLFDRNGQVVHQVSQAFPQHYPQPGWVEHDPADLWHSQRLTAQHVLRQAGAAHAWRLGVTNQRNHTHLDRESGH